MSNEKLINELTEKKQNPIATMRDFLEKHKQQLVLALPKHLSADRMIRLACTEISKNPALLNCDKNSLFGAIIQSSQLGLEIGSLGQAYLIPFKNRKTGGTDCQFIPGYKGLLALARRSGELKSISTHIVYERDQFEMSLGIDEHVKHTPYLLGDRGKEVLVYGVAKFKDGGHQLEWMSIDDLNKIRARSQSSAYGAWVTDYGQMVRKTIIRRMCNYLPMNPELQNAIQILDAHDEGKSAIIDDGVVVTSEDLETVEVK